MSILVPILIGGVAGLRTMVAPAAIAIAAKAGWIDLSGTWGAFMGSTWAVGIFCLLALVELVADQLPSTPSRKVPQQFGARLISGGFCGALLGTVSQGWMIGAVLGIIGAILGTFGGAWARGRMALAFGKDRPAALIEDAVAILGALAIAGSL